MTRRVAPLLALAALGFIGSPLCADVIREGTGALRADLDKMELLPFPNEAWSKLSSWTNGDALSQAKIEGKPVLILTWASWHPSAARALQIGQKMADKYGGQGLIVLGVHNPQGWEDAAKFAADHGAKFLLAHDAKGEFRKELKVDHDPEYYVLDRAGHLRYAAVSSISVDEACSTVVGETPEVATALPKNLQEEAAKRLEDSRKMIGIRSGDAGNMPEVPPDYVQPPEAAYKDVNWPRVDPEKGKDFGLIDQQSQNGKKLEPKLNFNPAAFHPAKPETQGRALVIFLWHPDIFSSYGPVIPIMDRLKQSNPRDVAIVGDMVPLAKLDPQRANSGNPQDQEQPDKLAKRYEQFAGSRKFRYALAVDPQATAMSYYGTQYSSNKAPGAIIVSTDGVVRWAGDPTSSDFKYAIDSILANDPGIQARRAGDQKFLESSK